MAPAKKGGKRKLSEARVHSSDDDEELARSVRGVSMNDDPPQDAHKAAAKPAKKKQKKGQDAGNDAPASSSSAKPAAAKDRVRIMPHAEIKDILKNLPGGDVCRGFRTRITTSVKPDDPSIKTGFGFSKLPGTDFVAAATVSSDTNTIQSLAKATNLRESQALVAGMLGFPNTARFRAFVALEPQILRCITEMNNLLLAAQLPNSVRFEAVAALTSNNAYQGHFSALAAHATDLPMLSLAELQKIANLVSGLPIGNDRLPALVFVAFAMQASVIMCKAPHVNKVVGPLADRVCRIVDASVAGEPLPAIKLDVNVLGALFALQSLLLYKNHYEDWKAPKKNFQSNPSTAVFVFDKDAPVPNDELRRLLGVEAPAKDDKAETTRIARPGSLRQQAQLEAVLRNRGAAEAAAHLEEDCLDDNSTLKLARSGRVRHSLHPDDVEFVLTAAASSQPGTFDFAPLPVTLGGSPSSGTTSSSDIDARAAAVATAAAAAIADGDMQYAGQDEQDEHRDAGTKDHALARFDLSTAPGIPLAPSSHALSTWFGGDVANTKITDGITGGAPAIYVQHHQLSAIDTILRRRFKRPRKDAPEQSEHPKDWLVANPNAAGLTKRRAKTYASSLAGLILADKCGLGKTLTTLVTLALEWREYVARNPGGPFKPNVVCVPPQVLNVWIDEYHQMPSRFNGLFLYVANISKVTSLGTVLTNEEMARALHLPGGQFDQAAPSTAGKIILTTHSAFGGRVFMELGLYTTSRADMVAAITDLAEGRTSDESALPRADIDRIKADTDKVDFAMALKYLGQGLGLGKAGISDGKTTADAEEGVDGKSRHERLSAEDVHNFFDDRVRMLVVDEAHALKNRRSQTNVALRTVHPEFTLLLTATPIMNRCADYQAYLEIISPAPLPAEIDLLGLSGEADLVGIYTAADMDPAVLTSPDLFRLALKHNSLTNYGASAALPPIMEMTTIGRAPGDHVLINDEGDSVTIAADLPTAHVHTLVLTPNMHERLLQHDTWLTWAPCLRGGSPRDDGRAKAHVARDADVAGSLNLQATRALSQASSYPYAPIVSKLLQPDMSKEANLEDVVRETIKEDGGLLLLMSTFCAGNLGPANLIRPEVAVDVLARHSPKLRALSLVLLHHVQRKGDKVIVMTENPMISWIVRMFVDLVGIPAVEITSATTAEDRGKIIRAWNSAVPGPRVLVSNSRLIGVGQNLQKDSHVLVIFELQRNFSQTMQIIGRVQRIGQSSEQHIYILHSLCSWDEKQAAMNAAKYHSNVLPSAVADRTEVSRAIFQRWATGSQRDGPEVVTEAMLAQEAMARMKSLFGLPGDLLHADADGIQKSFADCGADSRGEVMSPSDRSASLQRFLATGRWHFTRPLPHELEWTSGDKLAQQKAAYANLKRLHGVKAAKEILASATAAIDKKQREADGDVSGADAWGAVATAVGGTPSKRGFNAVSASAKRLDRFMDARATSCMPSRLRDSGYVRAPASRHCTTCIRDGTTKDCFRPCHRHEQQALAKLIDVLDKMGKRATPTTAVAVLRKFLDSPARANDAAEAADLLIGALSEASTGCTVCASADSRTAEEQADDDVEMEDAVPAPPEQRLFDPDELDLRERYRVLARNRAAARAALDSAWDTLQSNVTSLAADGPYTVVGKKDASGLALNKKPKQALPSDHKQVMLRVNDMRKAYTDAWTRREKATRDMRQLLRKNGNIKEDDAVFENIDDEGFGVGPDMPDDDA